MLLPKGLRDRPEECGSYTQDTLEWSLGAQHLELLLNESGGIHLVPGALLPRALVTVHWKEWGSPVLPPCEGPGYPILSVP